MLLEKGGNNKIYARKRGILVLMNRRTSNLGSEI